MQVLICTEYLFNYTSKDYEIVLKMKLRIIFLIKVDYFLLVFGLYLTCSKLPPSSRISPDRAWGTKWDVKTKPKFGACKANTHLLNYLFSPVKVDFSNTLNMSLLKSLDMVVNGMDHVVRLSLSLSSGCQTGIAVKLLLKGIVYFKTRGPGMKNIGYLPNWRKN